MLNTHLVSLNLKHLSPKFLFIRVDYYSASQANRHIDPMCCYNVLFEYCTYHKFFFQFLQDEIFFCIRYKPYLYALCIFPVRYPSFCCTHLLYILPYVLYREKGSACRIRFSMRNIFAILTCGIASFVWAKFLFADKTWNDAMLLAQLRDIVRVVFTSKFNTFLSHNSSLNLRRVGPNK